MHILINKYKELIYYLGFSIWLSSFIISSATLIPQIISQQIISVFKYFGLLIICFKIILCDFFNYTVKQFIKLLLIFLLFVISCYYSKQTYLLQLLILVIGFKDTNFKTIAKTTIIIESLILIMTISFSIAGIIDNRVFFRDNTPRYCLGFIYTSLLSIYVLNLSMLLCLFKKFRTNFIFMFIIIVLNLVVFIITDIKTSLFCFFIYLMLVFILEKKWLYNIPFSGLIFNIADNIFYIFAFLSFALSLSYNGESPFYSIIDSILTSRIRLGHDALINFGTSFFGQNLTLIGNAEITFGSAPANTYNYIDSSYLQIGIIYGLFILLIVLFLFKKTLINLRNNKEYYSYTLLFVIALHSFVEDQLLFVSLNIFILCWSNYILSNKKSSDLKIKDILKHCVF